MRRKVSLCDVRIESYCRREFLSFRRRLVWEPRILKSWSLATESENSDLRAMHASRDTQERKKHINIKKYPENPPVGSHPKNSLCGGSFPGKSRRRDPPPHIKNLGSQIFMLGTPFHSLFRSRPGKTKPKKGPKREVHEFRPFLLSLVFFLRKLAEYGFGEYGFERRTQWVFWGSLSSGGRTQWVPLRPLFVCQNELTKFFAELTEFAPKLSEAQWVLFSDTVLSKQYSATVSLCVFLRKTSKRFTSNFCSGVPLRKVHELTFLWFGLPGPLLIYVGIHSVLLFRPPQIQGATSCAASYP